MRPLPLRGRRVLLRDWSDADLAPFAELNADVEVMRYFAAPLTRDESDAVAARLRDRLHRLGWGLWALQTADIEFAGFVGLAAVPFDMPLVGHGGPQVEIGWRLSRAAWGQGLASEGAALALDFARRELRLARVLSFTALGNLKSTAVMRRVGLQQVGEFDHPRLMGHALQRHVLYATPAGWAPWPRGPTDVASAAGPVVKPTSGDAASAADDAR